MNGLRGKTVLVTGGTGFIGARLVARLRSAGDVRLVLLSRRPPAESRPGETWVAAPLDRLTRETWRAAGVERFDVVFHLAAYIPRNVEAADRIAEVYRDNLLGTRALLESLPIPPGRIVFASTIDVYAPPGADAVLNEDSPLGPRSLYGASKVFCEQVVRTHARSNGCGFAILRYGHVFGPGEQSFERLIPETIRRLLRGEPPVVYGDGSVERDFLHVEDVVEATLRAAVADVREIDRLNVVRGVSRPVREIVEMLMEITGFPGAARFLPDRRSGCSWRFDNRRLFSVLGRWPLVPMEDGLREEVADFGRMS